MKIYSLLLFLLIAGVLHGQNGAEAPPQPSPGATPKSVVPAALAALQQPYNATIAGLTAENQKWLAAVENWYLPNLQKMQTDYTKAGDLDGALAVKAERERFAAHGETTADQIAALPAALRALRATYDASLKRIADDLGRKKLQEGQRYQASLEALKRRTTISGDLDQALLVKTEEDRITAELAALTPAPVPAPATPSPPVASTIFPRSDASTPGANDRVEALLGTWRFTYDNNWSGARTFSKDGTFVGEGFAGVAKWTIVGKKVVLHYPSVDLSEEAMPLPLNPAGTKVTHPRSVVTAVKEK